MEPVLATPRSDPRASLWRAGIGFLASLALMLAVLVALNAGAGGSNVRVPELRGAISVQ